MIALITPELVLVRLFSDTLYTHVVLLMLKVLILFLRQDLKLFAVVSQLVG